MRRGESSYEAMASRRTTRASSAAEGTKPYEPKHDTTGETASTGAAAMVSPPEASASAIVQHLKQHGGARSRAAARLVRRVVQLLALAEQ